MRDHINFLEGEFDKTNDPQNKEKLSDLIVAIKMTEAGKDFENSFITPLGYYKSWVYAMFSARAEQKEKQKGISVRGLNQDLFIKARSQAIREGKNIGEWLNEAIGYRLAQIEIGKAEAQKRRME